MASIEARLVDRLELEEATLSVDETPIVGSWKGQPARLSYRRWRGPKVAIARTVTLVGHELEIANLVAVARAPLDAPVLGVDLIAARPDAGLVVADLSPLTGAGCELDGLPDWARTIFSAEPVFARVNPVTAPDALSRVSGMCDRFVDLVRSADALTSSHRDAALARYRDQHLQDERMRSMLSHIFGDAIAVTLMNDVLFPPELVDDVCA